jgi:dTDP-4-amino-4,6-dideoxygalactose transaminase
MFQVVLPVDRLAGGRPAFLRAMAARQIGVGVHYPPVHLFTLYRDMGWKRGDFPHAERVGSGTVTLPLFPAMTGDDVVRVCAAAAEAIAELSRT